MSARFEELERTEGVVYGACAGIWVMMLFAEPKLRDMAAARPALSAMARRCPRGYPTLTWVLPQAGFKMDADARHLATEITREAQPNIVAQATLIEGSGFQVAAVRAIVSGMDLMARTKAPRKVLSDLPEAVAWCLQSASPTERAPGPQVTASLEALRASVLVPA